MPGIEGLITKAQLRWVGHVIPMDSLRLLKIIFFKLSSAAKNIRRPLKCFKDCLKISLGTRGILLHDCKTLAKPTLQWVLPTQVFSVSGTLETGGLEVVLTYRVRLMDSNSPLFPVICDMILTWSSQLATTQFLGRPGSISHCFTGLAQVMQTSLT